MELRRKIDKNCKFILNMNNLGSDFQNFFYFLCTIIFISIFIFYFFKILLKRRSEEILKNLEFIMKNQREKLSNENQIKSADKEVI